MHNDKYSDDHDDELPYWNALVGNAIIVMMKVSIEKCQNNRSVWRHNS